MQQLECPRDRSVVSNGAKEVVRNRQNWAPALPRLPPLRKWFGFKGERHKPSYRSVTPFRCPTFTYVQLSTAIDKQPVSAAAIKFASSGTPFRELLPMNLLMAGMVPTVMSLKAHIASAQRTEGLNHD